MARIRYEIDLAPEAVDDYRNLDPRARAMVRNGIEAHLRHQPMRTSRSRIKRLRGLARPQYRLRLGEVRVFYDVVESRVQVLAIVEKSRAREWLERCGEKS